jgi:PAS domain S-box-containing protein
VHIQEEIKHLKEKQILVDELRNTRDYLENLLGYANAPIIVWNPDFRITRFNRAFERLTGRSAGEVLGNPLDILFPADRREEAMTHIRRTTSGERWESVEIPILRADGSVRIALWNSATLFAADGTTAIATIAQGQDITERKQAERDIRRRNRELSVLHAIGGAVAQSLNLQEILESALVATLAALQIEAGCFFLLEPDGETMTMCAHRGLSDEFVRNVGKIRMGEGVSGRAAVEKKPIVLDVAEYPSERLAPYIVREGLRTIASTPLISGGSVVGALNLGARFLHVFPPEELQLLTSIGLQLGQAVRNAQLYESVQNEVAERKQAEEETRSTEERFRLLFDSAMDGILLIDMENRQFKMGNRTICTMLGYSREEIPQLGVTNIHPEENLPHVIDVFERHARGELVVSPEIPVRRKDGSVFHADIASTQITFGDRRYLVGYFRDVTHERTLQKQVQTAQRMESVGTLAGGIAHDFNNVLTGILGYGELLRIRLADNPKALADLDEISRAAERAATLTRQLLTFARRQVVEPVNLDLRDVVKDLMKFFSKVAGEQIEVRTLLAADTPTIRADRGQIEQVLMNLIINAKDALGGGGQLLVETGGVTLEEEYIQEHQYMKKGRYALLVVSDTGIGMDETTRERAFEPFFTTKELGKGTGLGLSVVYGIVKQHNGSINLYSEPGKGSTIKIYFPEIEGPPDVILPVKSEPIRGGKETILLAEDEESIRKLAERILKDMGYTVLMACNGEEAVETFRGHREEISLAVLDVVMPRMGGKEAYEVMRKEKPGLKAIFMSGYSGNAIHEAFVIQADTPFLGKPFAPTVLVRKVREVLDGT